MQTTQMLFVRGVLAVAAVAAFAVIRCWRRIFAASGERGESVENGVMVAVPDVGELLRHALQRDLGLAAEHVYSIRCLLEIANQHQQPIPSVALTNLDLVSKHLGAMQRQIETFAEDEEATAVNSFAHRRETRSPLHPRPPSFACRVSPSDKSKLCD
jgi:hypothetical protein